MTRDHPPGPDPGPPPGGEWIKGKGLPFDSITTLLNFALAGALEEKGSRQGGERRRRRRRRTEEHLPHADRVGGFRQLGFGIWGPFRAREKKSIRDEKLEGSKWYVNRRYFKWYVPRRYFTLSGFAVRSVVRSFGRSASQFTRSFVRSWFRSSFGRSFGSFGRLLLSVVRCPRSFAALRRSAGRSLPARGPGPTQARRFSSTGAPTGPHRRPP